MAGAGRIKVGIGGWRDEPWRSTAIDRWAAAARASAVGGKPPCLCYSTDMPTEAKSRDVVIVLPIGAKERVPAGAEAVIARLASS